jgi:MoxR-like ATPase
MYEKLFDPPLVPAPVPGEHLADRAAAAAYVYDDDLVLAVNVALATRRPLLLRGRPGTGKSSLARNVALHLRRRFYPHTVSSRTQARDLLWTVDDVARLSDATTTGARERSAYVAPGVLWWAFAPASAAARTAGPDPNQGVPGADEAVVLLDEIDKADPDVPNDLLEPLGVYRFRAETGELVEATDAPLVVLTTNEERDLPRAFLRRCVVQVLPSPTRTRLRQIAQVQLGAHPGPGDVVHDVDAIVDVLAAASSSGEHIDVSIAEFLDLVTAARSLGIRPGHPAWPDLLAATTTKPALVDLR